MCFAFSTMFNGGVIAAIKALGPYRTIKLNTGLMRSLTRQACLLLAVKITPTKLLKRNCFFEVWKPFAVPHGFGLAKVIQIVTELEHYPRFEGHRSQYGIFFGF